MALICAIEPKTICTNFIIEFQSPSRHEIFTYSLIVEEEYVHLFEREKHRVK